MTTFFVKLSHRRQLWLFKFYTPYEFRFSDWLILSTWYWAVTKLPPWRHFRGVRAVEWIQHTTVITPWLRQTQSFASFFFVAVFSVWIIKMLTHSLPVLVRWQWTLNFQYRTRQNLHYSLAAGGVRPMIAKHAGRNRKIAHLYQRRRRVHIKLPWWFQ